MPDGKCVAALNDRLVFLDTESGETKLFNDKDVEAPFSLAADSHSRVFVSDAGTHQLKVFDRNGKLLRTMGKKGGQRAGCIDPKSFFKPGHLAVDMRGRLWILVGDAQLEQVGKQNEVQLAGDGVRHLELQTVLEIDPRAHFPPGLPSALVQVLG